MHFQDISKQDLEHAARNDGEDASGCAIKLARAKRTGTTEDAKWIDSSTRLIDHCIVHWACVCVCVRAEYSVYEIISRAALSISDYIFERSAE